MDPDQIAEIEETIKRIDLAMSAYQRQIKELQEKMAQARAQRAEQVRKLPNERRIDHLFDHPL